MRGGPSGLQRRQRCRRSRRRCGRTARGDGRRPAEAAAWRVGLGGRMRWRRRRRFDGHHSRATFKQTRRPLWCLLCGPATSVRQTSIPWPTLPDIAVYSASLAPNSLAIRPSRFRWPLFSVHWQLSAPPERCTTKASNSTSESPWPWTVTFSADVRLQTALPGPRVSGSATAPQIDPGADFDGKRAGVTKELPKAVARHRTDIAKNPRSPPWT